MRRGLISRSPVELPDAALDARLKRLRAAMADAVLGTLLIYTNNTRPGAVSWLTGFVPYFSEGLLMVPLEGALRLVVALTMRVKPWIEQTSRVGEVIHAPQIGLEAGRLLATAGAGEAVGVVEFDNLPAGVVEDLRNAAPQLSLSDASEVFAGVRAKADPAEIMLTTQAAAIAAKALAAVPAAPPREVFVGAGFKPAPTLPDLPSPAPPRVGAAGAVIAAVERVARSAGAEEVYVALATDLERDRRLRRIEGEAALGEAYAVRATVAYKGSWVRATRTACSDGNSDAAARAAARFAAAVAQLPDISALDLFPSFLVEGCRIAEPLAPLAGSRLDAGARLAAGMVVSVQAEIVEDGEPFLFAAPVLLGGPGEAAGIIGRYPPPL